MKLVADLHIHSHFSRATSKDLTFEHLAKWAQLKGVHIVGTGDIAHPGWLQEIRANLAPAEEGLFRLKDEQATRVKRSVPPACQGDVRFLLAGEISTIYKKKGATRKVHHVVFAPDLAAVERLQARLEKIGNIRSDGRPILGLPSRDLLEILLEIDERCHLIPAHIWTPWFALLGSKSGYDSVEECFDDLAHHIFALETGLSSDPPMNWRVSALDRYTLVSNSDAHSPQKLAREATLFDAELSYAALFASLRTGDPATFRGTIEFFPEEGKYHLDGHRACGICWEPPTTLAHQGICPTCGKEVTIGVMHRVEQLADRATGERPGRVHPFTRLVPLSEVLGQAAGVGAGSKQVDQEYERLLSRLGPELTILREIPLQEIKAVGGERLADAIGRMRRGEVLAKGGYDGEYGVINLFANVGAVSSAQMALFDGGADITANGTTNAAANGRGGADITASGTTNGTANGGGRADITANGAANGGIIDSEPTSLAPAQAARRGSTGVPSPYLPPSTLHTGLNPQQCEAAQCVDTSLIIIAGPGTGKTRTLTVRIAGLIQDLGVRPEAILAITFTNKAAGEMMDRLVGLLGIETAERATVKTFHALGAMVLREHASRLGLNPQFAILNEDGRQALLKQVRPDLTEQEVDQALLSISAAKNRLLRPDSAELADELPIDPGFAALFHAYEAALGRNQALDFDDLISRTVQLLETCPDVLQTLHARFGWISVDEYQDVNLAQYRLLRLLASGGANLCVIGDPDQAIYGFRGADRRYVLAFQDDYPTATVLTLYQNYRSTQLILDAAMQVMGRTTGNGERDASSEQQRRRRQAIEAVTRFAEQVKLGVHHAPTDKAEAEYVVHQIERMVGGTSHFSLDSGRVEGAERISAQSFADFAVLYRLGAQSRLLAEAFERSGIPYQTVGQTPLYARKPVREILAYLWLLHTPASQLHQEAVRTAHLAESFPRLKQAYADGVAVAPLIQQIDAHWTARHSAGRDAADARLVHQLVLRAIPFGANLTAFLESTTLQSETDAYDPRADRVTLMTLHASKGLEFPVVFIVGCEEGLLPYQRPAATVDVDEERRLFYVGLTRAQRQVVLVNAKTRFLYGQRMDNPPSRFVDDVEAALKEVQQMQRRASPPEPAGVQLELL